MTIKPGFVVQGHICAAAVFLTCSQQHVVAVLAVASLDTCSATAAAVIVGPYDFRDAVNADGIAESSHKNGIYSLTWNFTECVKDLINQK